MKHKVHETDYAYAVARVRANELSLLTEADVEQLIDADSYSAAMKILGDSGWGDPSEVKDYAEYLENYFKNTRDLLTEVMGGDMSSLDLLLIPNDMQNLKAALKSLVSQHDAKDVYTSSTVFDTETIRKAVAEKRFSDLPDFMKQPAQDAYDVLVSTANGQVADAIIDRATLEEMVRLGNESGSPVLKKIAERKCAAADIKTALRGAATKKSADFLDKALAECDTVSVSSLKEAALSSQEAVLDYLQNTDYRDAAEEYKKSTSAFEKWCDDILMECVYQARYTAFGVDPLVAYYIARDAEIKTVRIVLSAKKNNLSKDVIRERVRTLYV